MSSFFRGRRLRRSAAIRDLVRETHLSKDGLIMPYFVVDTQDSSLRGAIQSMPGQYQFSLKQLLKQVDLFVEKGLKSVILFGVPKSKDPQASEAYTADGIVQKAVRALKKEFPQLIVITDVCLCEYTSHGHCGLLQEGDILGKVLNDPSLNLLAKTAVSHAEAGADIIAPSDMMDGRILALRNALDKAGFTDLPIMSYAAKYASAYYGPFRDAAESTPKFGDRKSYQMDPANVNEAMREVSADLAEGADIIMVKPAGPYQDVIRLVRDRYDCPVAAYQVSGEYAMIRAAGINGWINEDAVILESLLGICRAGASMIITYFTEHLLAQGLVS